MMASACQWSVAGEEG